jgi:hypothetical protein
MSVYDQASCPCRNLASEPTKTNHQDEMIVFDVPMTVMHRCLGCGRRFNVQMVPGDYMVGSHRISEGYQGKPLLERS